MSKQHQLHQLVIKENELSATWQAALEKVEKDIREYNDKQQNSLFILALSPDFTKEIKKILKNNIMNKKILLVF